MGQQLGTSAFALAGNIIGSFIGGPIGGSIGGFAGGIIGSLIFNRAQKPLIPDWQLSQAAWGHPRIIIFGQVRIPATFMWQSPIRVKEHGLSAKGLSGQSAYSYYQSAMMAFCDAEVSGPARMIKIWTDGKLALDNTATNPTAAIKYKFGIRTYDGSESQIPDFLYAQWVSQNVLPGEAVPAYRGTAHIVFDNIDLSHYGGRFPQVTALWSNQFDEATLAVPLNRLTSDISTDVSIKSMGVDWQRYRVYQQSNDGTIRIYDMQTGNCVNAKLWTDFWPLGVPIEDSGSGPLFTGPLQVGIIGAGQGGFLYMTNQPRLVRPVFTYSHCYLFTIDPTTMSIQNSTIIEDVVFVLADFVTSLVPFKVTNPSVGSIELVAGTWKYAAPFIVDPTTPMDGTTSDIYTGERPAAQDGAFLSPPHATGPLPVFYTGLNTWNEVVIGNNDPITGIVDVWILSGSSSPFISPDAIGVYRMRVQDKTCNRSSFELIAILTPADFGHPTATFFPFTLNATIYDASDDTLVLSCPLLNSTIKWSTGGVAWQEDILAVDATQGNGQFYVTDRGTVGAQGSNFSLTDIASGEHTLLPLPAGHIAGQSFGYDGYSNALVGSLFGSTQLYLIYLQRITPSEYPVAGIITILCEKAGLTVDMIDTDLVTQTVWGYAITESKPAGACLSDLCDTFQIDIVESDYVLRFVPRGQAAAATIPQADLMPVDPNDDGKFLVAKEAQEQEMPLQLNVRFVDPALDYQPNASYGKRTALPVPTQFSRRVKTVDLPIVATATEARQIAEAWLYTLWAERNTYQQKLPTKYLFLDPADAITVNLDNGDSYSMRIEQSDTGADWSTELQLASEDATVYDPGPNAAAVTGYIPQVLVPSPFVDFLPFNVPLLLDTDDVGGVESRVYYAAGGETAMPTSAVAFLNRSLDGASFVQVDTIAVFARWGRTQSILADTPTPFCTDYINTVTVSFAPGVALPTNCTYLDMMNGVNACLVGSEIIQFMTVEENSNGSVTLSGMVRGRRGTDWATGKHASGELVVLLNQDGSVRPQRLPIADIGNNELYKLVPGGRTPDQVPTDGFVYLGYDLKPYAPVHFARETSGADLALSWVRRTRIGGLLIDGTDTVPLGEATEGYEAYIIASAAARDAFDPTSPATYVRAFTALTAPTATYTAADMTADGFTPATDTLFLIVYQLSAVIGRGFQGYQAIPAF